MGKENFDSFESTMDEGVNLDSAFALAEDLSAMQERDIPLNKATLAELQSKIKELMDLQTAFGAASPKEIGVALTKLRYIQRKHLESLEVA